MIVENGTIVAGANSLASLQFADDYHVARGASAWSTADQGSREAALVRATDFVCTNYARHWRGSRVQSDQPLCWPRQNVYDDSGTLLPSNTIPQVVQRAVAVLALDGLTADLNQSTARVVKQIGAGPVSITYADETPTTTNNVEVDKLLQEVTDIRAGTIRLMRSTW